ncbi:MAG: YbaK/EbsC family protein [Acidobacteriota bacterium]
MQDDSVYQNIRKLLETGGADFREMEHPPTHTSEESAEARGEPMRIGGKALVLKIGEDFAVFVLSAARKLDSKRVRKYFGLRGIRFASREELKELTGLEPGAVPPFGRPVLPFDLYLDRSILLNERIAFNAGSLTRSIIMDREAYTALAHPTIFDFSKD